MQAGLNKVLGQRQRQKVCMCVCERERERVSERYLAGVDNP